MRITRVYPHKPGLTKFLGTIEASVMLATWEGHDTVANIYKHIINEEGKDIGYSTVFTVLRRLIKKKLLVRQREGKRDIYAPVYSSEADYVRQCLNALLDGIGEDYGIELRAAYESLAPELEEANDYTD